MKTFNKILVVQLVLLMLATACSKDNDPVANQQPETPLLFAPIEDEENVELTGVELKWQTSQDPDGDEVSYNVYLGQQNPPQTQVASLAETKYMLDDILAPNTKYFWQVLAKDSKGNESVSKVAAFNTRPATTAELLIGKWQLESAQDDNGEPVALTDCDKQSTYDFSKDGIFALKYVYTNNSQTGECRSQGAAAEYSVVSSSSIRVFTQDESHSLELVSVSETELIAEVLIGIGGRGAIGTYTRIP
jgi:hypothetical protein